MITSIRLCNFFCLLQTRLFSIHFIYVIILNRYKTEVIKMDIGERIRFVRQFRGLTQTELAEKSGLSADENGRIRISQYENGTRVPRKDMLEKISKALHINSMYLNMDDHTEALDFVFTLLDWDRTTDFIIKKETIDNENHYLIDLNTNLFDDFLEAWMQKKADLKNGKISNDEYIEWTINYPTEK